MIHAPNLRHVRICLCFAVLCLVWLMLPAPAAAQAASSPVEGVITFVVPAGQARTLSLPLLATPAGSGRVRGRLSAVGADYVESLGAGWLPGFYSDPAAPYLLRLTSGAAAGRFFVVAALANTGTRLFVQNDGTPLDGLGIKVGEDGDHYELLPADTLASLFGTDLLAGATTSTVADNVQLWQAGMTASTYYFNTTRARWELSTDTASSPSRDHVVLRPDRGLLVRRRAATELVLRLTGRLTTTGFHSTHLRSGATLAAPGFPLATTLGELALQAPDRIAGWQGAAATTTPVTAADTVQVWSGTTWTAFYYDTGKQRWQRMGDATGADRNGFEIGAGQPVLIQRRNSGGALTAPVRVPLPFPLP